jgi:hypothetical protein
MSNGKSYIDFGGTLTDLPVAQTFKIENVGTAELDLDGGSLTLPAGYSLVTPFASTVTPADTTGFTIQLDAATAGSYSGTVSFEDCP